MVTDRLRLRPLRVDDEGAVRAAQEAMAPDGFVFAFDLERDTEWPAYVQAQSPAALAVPVRSDRVPSLFLVAEVDGEIVGRSSIRFELSDFLLTHGGHIGYGVLPHARRQGYATEILRQSLVITRARGIERALLTCDDDNLASIGAIERCGGRLDPEWPRVEPEGAPVSRRYWIA